MKPRKLYTVDKIRYYEIGADWKDAQPVDPTPLLIKPLKGLSFEDVPTALPIGFLTVAQNVRVKGGQLVLKPGLETFYDTALDDIVMFIDQYYKSDGTGFLMILTLKSLYYYDEVTSTAIRIPWTYTTGTASVTGTAVSGSGGMAWLSNARAGDRFKIDSDGTYVTIASVDADDGITLSSAYPSAASGAYTIDRYLGGTVDDAFATEVSQDKYVFSQGVDPVLTWDGSAPTISALSADCPPCRAMKNFAGRLCIGYTVEGGTTYPYRVRWPVIDDVTDWTGTGSGYEDIDDTSDWITTLDVLGNQLIVYKERTIVHGRRTGYAVPAISFLGTKTVNGVGCFTAGGLLNLGDEHLFVGADNLYSYDGANLAPIGNVIVDELLDRINPEKLGLISTLYIEETQEWYIFVPWGASQVLNAFCCFNLKTTTYTFGTMPTVYGTGFYERQATYTFNNAPWTFDTVPGRFDDRRMGVANPLNLVALEDNKLYNFTDEVYDDASAAIELDIQTPDFTAGSFGFHPSHNVSLHEIEVAYTATAAMTITCSVSLDGGNTWLQVQTITFPAGETSEEQYYSVPFLLTGRTIRFRMYRNTTGEPFSVTSFKFFVTDAGAEGR